MQVEKEVKTQNLKGLLVCFFEEWRFLIIRKRKSRMFRSRQLQQNTFKFWRHRAISQLRQKERLEEEQVTKKKAL